MSETYSDLLIRVRPKDQANDAYPVEAELSDGSAFFGGALRVDAEGLLLAEALQDPAAYGLALFDALFSGPMHRAYERAFEPTAGTPVGRAQIRLWIDDAASELDGFNWEGMYHRRGGSVVPLSLSTRAHFSRFVSLSVPGPPPVPAPDRGRPIRMLFAVSSPSNLDQFSLTPLDVAQEICRVRSAVGQLQQSGLLALRLLVGSTGLPSSLRRELEEEGYEIEDGPITLSRLVGQISGYHVVHLMCHGVTSRNDAVAGLILEDDEGRVRVTRDHDLVQLLAVAEQLPRLFFLMSGDSPRGHRVNPHVKLGRKLVRCGIPAAIVMQNVITIEGASLLTSTFYDSLLRHGYVDQALSEARFYLFNHRGGNGRDWLAPVLFTRLATVQLISFEEKPKTPLAVLPSSSDPTQTMAKGFVAPLGGVGMVSPDLSRRIRLLTDGLRQLHILVDLANQLRQMQEAFHPCFMIVEQAGADLLKIQVAPLTWVWQPLRSGSLKRLQLFLQQHAELPVAQWFPPLLEQAEIIDNTLSEVSLGPLARSVTTFNRQLTEAEPAVRQQLDQAIAELVSFADQTLGRLDTG